MTLVASAVDSLAVVTTVGAVAALAYYGYGRHLVGRGADATRSLTRLRRALHVGLPLAYVAALLGLAAAGWLDVLDAAAAALPGGETFVGDLLSLLALFAGPLPAVVLAYLGAFPAAKALRGVEMEWSTAALLMGRYAAGLVAAFVVLLAVLGVVTARAPPALALPAGVAVVALLVVAGAPVVVRVVQPNRAPDEAETERIDRGLERAGFEVAGLCVLETAESEQAFAVVRGPPGRRHLFVSDHLLSVADDDRLAAVLALQAGRARRYHLEVRLALTLLVLLGILGPIWGFVPVPDGLAWPVVGVTAVVGPVALWLGRRLVYRADDDAAERIGAAAVADAIESHAEAHDAPLSWPRRREVARMEPAPERRLRRLRESAGVE